MVADDFLPHKSHLIFPCWVQYNQDETCKLKRVNGGNLEETNAG